MDRRSLTLSLPDLKEDHLGFFRWGRVGGKVLVTNDAADWAFLTEAEFSDLLAGRVADGHPRFEDLQRKGFLRDGLDLDGLAARVAERNRHVRRGLHVHVVTLTQQSDPAAPEGRSGDLSRETAERIVALALQSASPAVTFELQGHTGEPLRNFDVLRHLVEVAQTHNARTTGKTLSFRLLSNFTGMTEEIVEWLIANDVLVMTRLDGPAAEHDANLSWKGGSAHADVVRWIEHINRRYAELGRDPHLWHVGALAVTTRRTLEAWREVIDEYVTHGLRSISLRPLHAAHVDPDTWATIGYSREEYLAFYRRGLDYILELNRRGVEITEGTALIFLLKMLTFDDPGIVDIQSPCGAGSNELAYDADGRVFPCDDARIADAKGESLFALGHVRDLALPDVLPHPTVRAIAAASLLDAQPMCADCWNKPFCGFSPVRNFVTQGDLFGQRPHCFQCKEHMAVSTRLFELLADESDTDTAEILKRWTVTRSPFAIDGRSLREAP